MLVRDLAITADGGTLRYRRLRWPLRAWAKLPRMLKRQRSFPWNAAVTAPEIIDSAGNRPAVRFGDGGRDGEGYVDGELELRGTIAPEGDVA